MTVYFIYKHDQFSPFLYAVTDKKYLKKSFMEERKKSMFTAIEKIISKEEFLEFCKHHSKYLLGRRGFRTNSPSSFNNDAIVYLTATDYEEMDVVTKEDCVFLEIGRYTDEEAKVFNKDILKALNILHYFEIYKFVNDNHCEYDYFVRGVDKFTSENYKIDNFGVFLYLYGNTINMKGLIKNEN